MSRIVFHIGMGKAGSTSIQDWLARHCDRLRDDHAITLLYASVSEGAVEVGPYAAGSANSADVVKSVEAAPSSRESILDSFFAQLDREADRPGSVVITSELFGKAVADGDRDLVQRINALGATHEVTLACYLRPQHQLLESGWRHWRHGRETRPSEFIARLDPALQSLRTVEFLQSTATDIDVRFRPCRRDLLVDGDAVVDFAAEILDLSGSTVDDRPRSNEGVGLDVANALTFLPEPPFWPSGQDHLVLEMVKELTAGPRPADSDLARRSRLVLQQACHDAFEDDNRRMLDVLGWPTDAWVPPVAPDLRAEIGDVSFDRMDELWRPALSAADHLLLNKALAIAWESRRGRPEATPKSTTSIARRARMLPRRAVGRLRRRGR